MRPKWKGPWMIIRGQWARAYDPTYEVQYNATNTSTIPVGVTYWQWGPLVPYPEWKRVSESMKVVGRFDASS